MIGRATASVQPTARRLVQRVWGLVDIDARQKWAAVWPAISALPGTRLRVLDAGCGDGTWTFELVRRRPQWTLIGIDRDQGSIDTAQSVAERLSVDRAGFITADFLDYHPDTPFDLVLSVASAHYLANDGRGAALFAQFARWLAPGGRLILFGPRRREDVPALSGLPAPFAMRRVFSVDDLSQLCADAGLQIEVLAAVVRRMGTLAKQIRHFAGPSPVPRALAYPLELALSRLDRTRSPCAATAPSSALLLVARRPHSKDSGDTAR